MITDLNDLYYFSEIVRYGGIAAAERATGEPRSKLSRKLVHLEDRLGIRLVERSTRRFRVTEVGQIFYRHCCNVIMEAEQAEAVVAGVKERPSGPVRFSCPTGMLETVTPILASFLAAYPDVSLDLLASNLSIDLIDQRVDLALRVRFSLDGSASLTMRALATSRRILVAAPPIAASIGGETDPEYLSHLPCLAFGADDTPEIWQLFGPQHAEKVLSIKPRLTCGELSVLRSASVAGLGVALIPDHFCREQLGDGRLVRLFPNWSKQPGLVHLVFTSKRGLSPAVRALIDHLVDGFQNDAAMDKPSDFSSPRKGEVRAKKSAGKHLTSTLNEA
ncbi:MAG: LysR family transcriptional regulator [Hyphomicrobiales bacterium]|nr:LysR family transcriptional regulator [Hyphomicrobiales bacterium]